LRPVVLVSLVVALAACSGGDDHPARATGPAATLTAPTTRPRPVTSARRLADARIARATVLRSRDLPGWTLQRRTSDAAGTATLDRLCPALARTRRDLELAEGGALPAAETAYVNGQRGLPVLRSKAYVLADPALASRMFALVSSKAYARCVAQSFTAPALGVTTVRYGTPKVSALAVRRIGNDTAAYRAAIPARTGATSFDIHLDLVAARRGRIVDVLVLGDTDLLPLSTRARAAIMRVVGLRLYATS